MTNNDWNTLRVLFPYVSFECQISNEKQIEEVVCKTAYRDMMPRTLKGIGNKENKPYKEKMLKYVTDRIIRYFKVTAPTDYVEFTAWHKETCKKMVDIFNDSDVTFTYGKAQKLVNIAFKNLLLFQGAKEEYFAYCHTPIDNNVLRICREKAKIDCIKDNWSSIDNYDYYLGLQNKISEYLNSNDNKDYRLENNIPATNLIFDYFAWIEGGGKDDLIEYWNNEGTSSKFYNNNTNLIKEILQKL